MPFTGGTFVFNAVYNQTTDIITITDATNYVGQGFTRTDADILFYGFYKATIGDSTETLTPNNTNPTLSTSWTLDLEETKADGYYNFKFAYAFDFAATGGTHQLGDLVRQSGTYFLYINTTASSAPTTDTTSWITLTAYDERIRLQSEANSFITRLSEKCRFDNRISFLTDVQIPDCAEVNAQRLLQIDAGIEAAKEFSVISDFVSAQKLIEGVINLCDECD